MQAYHRGMKAEGGWGACCTEYCSIHPESDDTSPRLGADLGRGRRAQPRRDVRPAARVRRAGRDRAVVRRPARARAWSRARRRAARRRSHRTSSSTSSRATWTRTTSTTVQQMYVDAALRARDAGFDIVYVYGAHAYLPFQFLSPFYNRRTDEYGGSFENRARFWRESLYKVREAVGDDCAIASRFAVDHLLGPISIQVGEDGVRFVEYCDDLVDLWDFTVGDIAEWGQNAGPSRFFEENHEKPYTGQVKAGNHTEQAGRRRRAHHQPRHDGRDHQLGPVRHHRRRAARRSRIRSCRRRSRRAGSTTSASASAATSASRAGRSAARRWSARRTRPPARSTAAAGTRRSSTRRPTATRACSSSAPARPGWSARWCSASARCRPCTWSRAPRRSAAA